MALAAKRLIDPGPEPESRVQSDPRRRSAGPVVEESPPDRAEQVIALQSTAGNAAVIALLRRQATLHRQPTATQGAGTETVEEQIVRVAHRPQPDSAKFRNGYEAVGLILRNFCQPDARYVMGYSYDAKLPGVSADLAGGRNGFAMLVVGDRFAQDTSAKTLPKRIDDVKAQLKRIEDWRFTTFTIDEQDLAKASVTDRLKKLKISEQRGYHAKVTDTAVKRYLTDLLISTPHAGATIDPVAGTATLDIRNVTVKLLPDKMSPTENETTFKVIEDPPGNEFNYDTDKGVVSDFSGPGATQKKITVEIQSAYEVGRREDPRDPGTSEYGRGTTAADIAAGTTSLQFHEGHHGLDYMEWIRTRPFPDWKGHKKMTPKQFEEAVTNYREARNKWSRDMEEFSRRRTDLVGKLPRQ
jgi:hypothetical protein